MRIHYREPAPGFDIAVPITPAATLLLAACAYPPLAEAIAATRTAAAHLDNTAWTELTDLCGRHRLAALTAHGLLAAGIAPPAALAAAAQVSMRGEIRAMAESRRLQTVLATEGLDPVLIKGFATALLAFGRAGLRYSRDIDILVRPAEVDDAAASLVRLGYVRVDSGATLPAGIVPAWRRTHKDMVFIDPRNALIVELHWRLFDNRHLLPRLGIDLATTEQFANISLRTLPRDAHLLYLCMHGAQHAWSRLKWLVDLNAILAQAPPGEAARLFRTAEAEGAGRAVAQAVLLCGWLFGLDVPDAIVAAYRRDSGLRWLVGVALSSALGGAADELEARRFGSTWKNISHYRLASGWRYWAAELWYDLHDVSNAIDLAPMRWAGPAARPLAWLLRHARPASSAL